MPAITISRQFGSGGSEIARRVADTLRWRLVDNAFIEGIARGLKATPAVAEAVDEHVPSLAERIADAFALGSGEVVPMSLGTPMPPPEQRVADVTRHVIDEAIARGPVVLVGRGAQSYLAHREDVLHVLCCAPPEALVERVMARDGLTREDADGLVRSRNRERQQYVSRHFGRTWLAPEHYHLVLNTAWLGIDGCVQIVADLARRRLAAS
jgi:cytidylate kinase